MVYGVYGIWDIAVALLCVDWMFALLLFACLAWPKVKSRFRLGGEGWPKSWRKYTSPIAPLYTCPSSCSIMAKPNPQHKHYCLQVFLQISVRPIPSPEFLSFPRQKSNPHLDPKSTELRWKLNTRDWLENWILMELSPPHVPYLQISISNPACLGSPPISAFSVF